MRWNASPTRSIACGAWRSRKWLAALLTIAWPSRGEQVAGVLGDRGQPAPAFARALGEPVEECAGRPPAGLAHQQPGLVDEHAAAAQRPLERAPDRVEAEQQRRRVHPLGEPRSEKQTSCPSGLHRWSAARRAGSASRVAYGDSRSASRCPTRSSAGERAGEVARAAARAGRGWRGRSVMPAAW